jgi:hypothetical protein
MDSDNTTKKQKIFTIFIAQLANTYRNFCVWKFLQKEEYNATYSRNNFFWGAVLDSGLTAFSIELSKLVEKSEKNSNLSIFMLLQEELNDIDDVLGKIRKVRNKNWAHFDLNTMLDQKSFYSELNLKWVEVEKVFLKLFEIVNRIKGLFVEKNATNYLEYFHDIEKKCENDVDIFMKKVKV